jgi:hypothetical protein
MSFETPRVSSGTTPFLAPEASHLPPSVRRPFQADSLGSYAKAEQGGGGCCVTLLCSIWRCVSWPFRALISCCCGDGGKREEKLFDQAYYELKEIDDFEKVDQFLAQYNMKKGEFPEITTAKRLFNCVLWCYQREKEVMPLLAEHVVDKINKFKVGVDVLNFGNSQLLSGDSAECIPAFVRHCILKSLEKDVASICTYLRWYHKEAFGEIFDEAFIKELPPKQKQKLYDWACSRFEQSSEHLDQHFFGWVKKLAEPVVVFQSKGCIIWSAKEFNQFLYGVEEIWKFLQGYDMANGRFPLIPLHEKLSAIGAFNCIIGINALPNKDEVFPKLVDVVFSGFRKEEDIENTLDFRKIQDRNNPNWEAVCHFVRACIMRAIDPKEGQKPIGKQDYTKVLDVLSQNNRALFEIVVCNEQAFLTEQGTNKLKAWAESKNYSAVLEFMRRTDVV